jgi:hypothetical protein
MASPRRTRAGRMRVERRSHGTCVPVFSPGLKEGRVMEDRKLELQLQLANRRMVELQDELERMLLRAKKLSEASRKRVMASMGLFHSSRMFIRH